VILLGGLQIDLHSEKLSDQNRPGPTLIESWVGIYLVSILQVFLAHRTHPSQPIKKGYRHRLGASP
jgi:hypothetical protein